MSADVVVVGGGPAGLASALALRRLGMRVRVLERRAREPGSGLDKVCGEGLMPDGLDHLSALGVDVEELAGRAFHGIRYLDEDSSAAGHFPSRPGLGVRRTELHRVLVDHALAAGVEIEWGRAADRLVVRRRAPRFALESAGAELTPGFVVVADGLRSPLRHAAGLARSASERAPRFGVRRHFRIAPWSDLVEVHWARGAEAYVTPLADDLVGVAILWRPRDEGQRRDEPGASTAPAFERRLVRFPRLAARLSAAPVVGRMGGLGPLRQPVGKRARANLFLVGDAAGYRDAITGEGLSLAFGQARLLAAVLARGREQTAWRRYSAAAERQERRPAVLTEMALLLSRHPRLRRRVLAVLERHPDDFDRILAVHARQMPPRRLGLARALRFGAELLRA